MFEDYVARKILGTVKPNFTNLKKTPRSGPPLFFIDIAKYHPETGAVSFQKHAFQVSDLRVRREKLQKELEGLDALIADVDKELEAVESDKEVVVATGNTGIVVAPGNLPGDGGVGHNSFKVV